jgi:ribosomal protein L3 glutamine methyltransferase
VIPGDCVVDFNFRFCTESTPESLQQRLTAVLDQHGLKYELNWTIGGLPFLTTPGTLVAAIQQAIADETGLTTELSTTGGTSDGRFIAQICPQVIEFGPPNATIHKVNEHVALSDIAPLKGALSLSGLITASAERLTQAGVAFGHGTQSAFDEAVWLVLWRLGLPLDTELDEVAEQAVTPEQQAACAALIEERIATRKPAAYLTQEAWLQGVSFYIDERAIVPRSLIAEVLADGTIDAWLSDQTKQVLDLCTGNGSLAVLAALAWPDVQVTGADISDDALAVAAINVERHDLQERVKLVHSDGLSALPGQFDLILCNPPYVCQASMDALPAEYRAEPELALAGGTDGMDFVRQLFKDAPSRMSEHAVLVLEIGNEVDHFIAAFPHLEVAWLDTSTGDDQVLLITRQALLQR